MPWGTEAGWWGWGDLPTLGFGHQGEAINRKRSKTFKDIIIMITPLQFCNFSPRKTLTVSGLNSWAASQLKLITWLNLIQLVPLAVHTLATSLLFVWTLLYVFYFSLFQEFISHFEKLQGQYTISCTCYLSLVPLLWLFGSNISCFISCCMQINCCL